MKSSGTPTVSNPTTGKKMVCLNRFVVGICPVQSKSEKINGRRFFIVEQNLKPNI